MIHVSPFLDVPPGAQTPKPRDWPVGPLSTLTLLPLAAAGEQGPPHLSAGGDLVKKPRSEPTLDLRGICPTRWPRAQNCM